MQCNNSVTPYFAGSDNKPKMKKSNLIMTCVSITAITFLMNCNSPTKKVEKAEERLEDANKDLQIAGVVATMYDQRKVLNRDVVDTIRKYFGELLFETLIRDNVALAEAPAQRKDIFAYSPSSPGSEDYLALCKELLTRTEGA